MTTAWCIVATASASIRCPCSAPAVRLPRGLNLLSSNPKSIRPEVYYEANKYTAAPLYTMHSTVKPKVTLCRYRAKKGVSGGLCDKIPMVSLQDYHKTVGQVPFLTLYNTSPL